MEEDSLESKALYSIFGDEIWERDLASWRTSYEDRSFDDPGAMESWKWFPVAISVLGKYVHSSLRFMHVALGTYEAVTVS